MGFFGGNRFFSAACLCFFFVSSPTFSQQSKNQWSFTFEGGSKLEFRRPEGTGEIAELELRAKNLPKTKEGIYLTYRPKIFAQKGSFFSDGYIAATGFKKALPFTVFFTEKELVYVHQNGEVKTKPLRNFSSIPLGADSSKSHGFKSFTYGEHKFILAYISHLDPSKSLFEYRDFYLIRQDGLILPYARDIEISRFQIKIDEKRGFFSLKMRRLPESLEKPIAGNEGYSAIRTVDLNAFYPEIKRGFRPGNLAIGKDLYLEQDVFEHFRNFSKDLRESDVFLPTIPKEYSDKMILGALKKESLVVFHQEPGYGKDYSMRSFIQAIGRGEYPQIPRTTTFVEIDQNSLVQGTRFSGTFEERLQALIDYSKNSREPVVIVVSELHSLRGAGTHSESSIDVFEMLKQPLAEGVIEIWATDTTSEFEKYFSSDPALRRRAVGVRLPDHKPDYVLNAGKNWISQQGLAPVSDPMLNSVIQISEQLDPVGSQPDKALRLLGAIFAQMELQLKYGVSPSKADIQAGVLDAYHLDAAEYDRDLAEEKIKKFSEDFHQRIVGNPFLKTHLLEAVEIAYLAGGSSSGPRLRIALTGQAGSGKTVAAKAYAKFLGLPDLSIRLENFDGTKFDLMSQVGEQIAKNSRSVLIFEEWDKARPDLKEALLDLLSEKEIKVPVFEAGQSSKGITYKKVKTQGLSVILVMNAGEGYLRQTSPDMVNTKSLEIQMRNEGISQFILDRVKTIPMFPAQSEAEFREILKVNLALVLEEISKQNLDFREDFKISVSNEERLLGELTGKYFGKRSAGTRGFAQQTVQVVSPREAIREMEERLRLSLARARKNDFHGELSLEVPLEPLGAISFCASFF